MSKTLIKRELNLEELILEAGGHRKDSKFCVMEAVAYVAGERWSDKPQCASKVIGAFLRSWNDTLPAEDRQKLKPYIVKVVGTASSDEVEDRRAWMAADWLVRTFAPAWLRKAGLTEHAEALASLPELTTGELAEQAQPIIEAAWSAADEAARSAARSAADAAADAAAWSAARSAAWSAADAAAWSAARSAAWSALADTVVELQASAFDLLDRMIEVRDRVAA